MAAGAFQMYHSFKTELGNGTMVLEEASTEDTFKIALFKTTHTPVIATDSSYTSLTNEVANGLGYSTGGYTLVTPTWDLSAGTVTFDAADPYWDASGGSIVGRYAVIYDDTHATKQLICYSDLDASSVTVTDGNRLTIQFNASGIFTLA